ncbi:PH domain-containing protein [Salinibacterium soli]|uniref:PH domain-containing protein n=1 Tax=Antiquaquibacter soli TaxID=3064523 RepID=A0ABT9BL58_9MICO|nr:PH domain-containing protein [Protaetiibacter sp. WY-16]MDO7881304.1 PH domain-containing protein [Protaetiibacter sp. WY-16]
MRFAPTSFRPAFGRGLSIATAVIVALGLAGFVVDGDWNVVVRFSWPLLLLAALAFALFWFPRVDVAEHEVTVVNVFTTVHVPWPAIENVDTKYALTLTTADGTVTAWASPAPNRYAAQAGTMKDARLAAEASGANPRPGDLPSTQSGAIALVIRSHWEDLRAQGLLDAGPEPGSVRKEYHVVTIAVVAALAVATVLGVLL